MVEFILTTLPKESRLLYLGPNFPAPYYYEPDVHLVGIYHFQPAFYNQPARALAEGMRREKIGYLLFMKSYFAQDPDGALRRFEGCGNAAEHQVASLGAPVFS